MSTEINFFNREKISISFQNIGIKKTLEENL